MAEICPVCGLPKELCMCEEIAREQQTVRISIDSRRYGKTVTVIDGIDENDIDINDLAKKLKNRCRRRNLQRRPHRTPGRPQEEGQSSPGGDGIPHRGQMRDNHFVRTELIGLDVEVLSEPYSGIAGKVVDETKNTFTIESAGTERMVPKPRNEFRFSHEGRTFVIRGSEITHRPEDRIKKVR